MVPPRLGQCQTLTPYLPLIRHSVRVSIVGLSAEISICKEISRRTKGETSCQNLAFFPACH